MTNQPRPRADTPGFDVVVQVAEPIREPVGA